MVASFNQVLATALVTLSAICATVALAEGPNGRYCGKLLSAGQTVNVETVLSPGPTGRLEGTYEFDDAGATTSGTLSERPGGSGLTRTFEWLDKYGTGLLVVTFEASLESFEGNWAAGDATPDQMWNGRKCAGKVNAQTSLAALDSSDALRDASPATRWRL